MDLGQLDLDELVSIYYNILKNKEFQECLLAIREHKELGSRINQICREKNIKEVIGDNFIMNVNSYDKKYIIDFNKVPEDNIKYTKIIVKKFIDKE